jgi:hypothetical protein
MTDEQQRKWLVKIGEIGTQPMFELHTFDLSPMANVPLYHGSFSFSTPYHLAFRGVIYLAKFSVPFPDGQFEVKANGRTLSIVCDVSGSEMVFLHKMNRPYRLPQNQPLTIIVS